MCAVEVLMGLGGRAHIRGGSRARLGQMRRSPITFSISTSEALVRVLRQSDTQRAWVSYLYGMQLGAMGAC